MQNTSENPVFPVILRVTLLVSFLPREQMTLSPNKGNGKTSARIITIYIKS